EGDYYKFAIDQYYIWNGKAVDSEDGNILDENLLWYIGDNHIGTGKSINITLSDLSVGPYVVILKARDSKGAWGSASIHIKIVDRIPEPKITSPDPGSFFLPDQSVTFTGEAFDSTDGKLYDTSLKWFSNKDNFLGYDTTLVVSSLSSGAHVITLKAANYDNIMGSTSINIIVNQPPIVDISAVSKKYYAKDASIWLNASANDPEDGDITQDLNFTWTSSIDQYRIWTGAHIKLDNLSLGEHIIKLKVVDSFGYPGFDSTSFTIKENLDPPAVSIVSPGNNSVFNEFDTIHFEGNGSDTEDGELPDNVYVWSSDKDGIIGNGKSISHLLSINEHNITLKVNDSDNMEKTETIKITIEKYNNPPVPVIISPQNNRIVEQGKMVYLLGNAADVEDTTLPDTAFIWKSDIDGIVGNNRELFINDLSAGLHTLSLSVFDKKEAYGSTSIYLDIQPSNWRTWTNGNIINSMQAAKNILWCGTPGGLIRWNLSNDTHAKFTTFDGLINNNINTLAFDSVNEILWIGTSKGLNKYTFDTTWHFEAYTSTTPNTLPDDYITSLVMDSTKNLWIATSRGLTRFKYESTKWETFTKEIPEKITALTVDKNNDLWIGTDAYTYTKTGLYRKSLNNWTGYKLAYLKYITALSVDNDGAVWVGTYSNGFAKYYKDIWTPYSASNLKLTDNNFIPKINSIMVDSENKVWFATPVGVSAYDSFRYDWTPYTTKGSMSSDNNIFSMSSDNNNIYLGSSIGIHKFEKKTLSDPYGKLLNMNTDIIANNKIVTITEDKNNYIWLGFDGLGGGANSFKGTEWHNYINNNSVWKVFVNNAGKVLLGTDTGLNIIGEVSPLLSNRKISAITEDSNEIIWVGTDYGEIYKDTSLLEKWSGHWIEDIDTITDLKFDTTGKLWIGSASYGLGLYDTTGGYLTENQLFTYPHISSDTVNSIITDNHIIWIATDNGLDKFENGSMSRIISDIKINSICKDLKNNIWLATDQGAYKYNIDTGSFTTILTMSNGLIDNDVNAVFVDKNDYKWFGTSSGLNMYLGE
ncbi:hypothetical protein HZA55_03745, partial [Candidatus Poribacteria bacterium]|nr:hypothetical protein [Candidatus Poribacteria bacterium]